MPINKATGYVTSDGAMCATLEEAQARELGNLFAEQGHPLIDALLSKRNEVLDILAMTPRSKPKARKQAGTTNPKRALKGQARERAASPTEAQAGFDAMRAAASASTIDRGAYAHDPVTA